MDKLNDGVDLYVEYLQSGVAQKFNLDLIKDFNGKIIIENVGGSAHRTLSRVLKKLGLEDVSNLGNVKFMVDKKEVQDEILKQYDNLPEYNGESIAEFKEKLRKE